jgi:hypothetical protein
MESPLDNRLKRRIERSLPDRPSGRQPYLAQAGAKRKPWGRQASSSGEDSSSDDDEDGGGRLGALTKQGGRGNSNHSSGGGGGSAAAAAGPSGRAKPGSGKGGGARKPLTAEERQRQLLTAPQAELSKWQRKRLRQKEKRAAGEGGRPEGGLGGRGAAVEPQQRNRIG